MYCYWPSVKVYVTAVVPTGNVAPGAWLLVVYVIGPRQLSSAVGSVQVAVWLQVSLPAPVCTVISVGQPLITGGVLSCTITLNVQVDVFSEPSVKVYVTAVVPTGNVAPGAWLLVVYVIGPRQLSSAVGSVHVAVWLQVSLPAPVCTVISVGQPLMTGGVLSCTITLNVQVDVFSEPSVKVYVTAVVPTGNVAPGAWLLVVYVIGPRQLSSAVGSVHVAVWLQVSLPAPVCTVISVGQPLMTGGVLSCTITLNVQVDVLGEPSVKVYVTAVVPTGNVAPGAWLLVVYVIGPRQLSSAVGSVHEAVWLQVSLPAPVCTVISVGQPLITGGVLSCTITLNVQVDVLLVSICKGICHCCCPYRERCSRCMAPGCVCH